MKYYPILLSKAGEFKALKELNITVKREVSPIIEILDTSLERVETKLIEDWSFAGNQVLLDFSNYNSITRDIVKIETLFDNLLTAGVNASPTIHPGSPSSLITLVTNLVAKYNCKVCLRASNNNGTLLNYNAQTTTLMAQIGISATGTILLIDLGYAENHNYNNLSALAIAILTSIPNPTQWADLVIASGSFPVNVSHLSPPNTVHRLPRYEWSIWQIIITHPNLGGLVKYSDYGNKNPVYGGEGGYAGSCSIKYTAEKQFVVYRGILSRDHANGNDQYIIFASRLIHAPEYPGAGFSWGDLKIDTIARESLTPPNRPGSATTWVEITQNHHITLLESLL
jgi:hypothetical protein